MVPIPGRASSLLVVVFCMYVKRLEFSKNKTERRSSRERQNNTRPINLLKVITLFTDYK